MYKHADELESAAYPESAANPKLAQGQAKGKPTQIGGVQTMSQSMLAAVGSENKQLLQEMASLQAKAPVLRSGDPTKYVGREWRS